MGQLVIFINYNNGYFSLLIAVYHTFTAFYFLSGKRVSNSRPAAWEAAALPTELFPQYLTLSNLSIFLTFHHFKYRFKYKQAVGIVEIFVGSTLGMRHHSVNIFCSIANSCNIFERAVRIKLI